MKIKVIVTGATGMVGEGVLHECLLSDTVEEVLIVNRRASNISHPKLKEIIHADFFYLSAIENDLKGYDACFFCLGVSSVGMKEDDYYKFTYTLTTNFAATVCKHNNNMVFCYVSGASTDSTEKGRMMWARVKGKTENDLIKMPFKNVYNFRPAIMTPTKGQKNTLRLYKYFSWLVPIVRFIAPNSILSLQQVGIAMINAATKGYDKNILEVKDILELAEKK
jgi:uncharacterized protein YbjT (DUF2867 family)